jgi:vancomycin aglycone glucosyltransferase
LLWAADERNWNRLFRDAVNEQRAALGLLPVRSVPRHVSTDHPWLAADPVLAPAASAPRLRVMQTGAWMLSDPAALPDQLDQFLADGEPPIYFGFGSMQAAAGTGRALVEAARILGRRAVISRGWGGLSSTDAATDAAADCIAIGDVSHEKLFARVAAIVHHGGAGTTTAAARAGKPQVVIPHLYDQYYWAHRVRSLGIGSIGPAAARLSAEVLADALREALRPQVAAPAHALAGRIELHGARIAAQRLIERFV